MKLSYRNSILALTLCSAALVLVTPDWKGALAQAVYGGQSGQFDQQCLDNLALCQTQCAQAGPQKSKAWAQCNRACGTIEACTVQ